MLDATNLFLTAELHFAARAAQGRVEAIDASPNLHWIVEVRDGDHTATLNFDTAPTLVQIALRMREVGMGGQVDVRSITVGRKRQRPLVLMPWMRAKAAPVVTARPLAAG